MRLLHNERQLEIRNVERQILRIEHAEHIDFLRNLLQAPLEFAHTRLRTRVLRNNVLNNLLGNIHPLCETHVFQSRWKEVLLRNLQLVLLLVALQMNHHHTVQQHLINLRDVVAREDEHGPTQVQRNPREILVLKVAVLYGIRHVYEQILDLLALRRGGNLVQLVKHQNHRHTLRSGERVHNLPRVRTLIYELVTRIRRRIRIAAQRNKLERPVQRLRNPVLNQTGLANARGANQKETQAARGRICNLPRDELENLEFGRLLAINGIRHTLPCALHERPALVLAIVQLHRHFLIDAKR